MKNQITKFYDDTNDFEIFEETKQLMFDNYAEEEGWESIDEITDAMVFHEINEMHNNEWIEFKFNLSELFKNHNYYLIKGVCGRWNGPAERGRVLFHSDELLDFVRHLDTICFYEKNGHFYIEGSHHDGSDRYELKRITEKGLEYLDNNLHMNDKYLHENIMKYNLFSGLPYFSRLVGA